MPTQRAFELNAQVSACLRETDRLLTRGLTDGQILMFREMAEQMLRNLDDWDGKACCCTNGSLPDVPLQQFKEEKKQKEVYHQ